MDARRTLLLLHPAGRDELTLTATTTASPENVIIDRMTPVGGDITIFWGDGDSTVQAPGDEASETHSYATAGTYQIRVTPASRIQQVDLHRSQLSGFNSTMLRDSPITYFRCFSIGNAQPNAVSSADMSAWTPTHWGLYSMPAGTYAIDSQHMSAWTPTGWYLYSMPAGDLTFTINPNHFAGWTTTTSVVANDNSLLQADVDALLWGMYQASVAPRTVAGGTINVGGDNAAPSGVFQAAAACPVTAATDGKEVAHELLNDGCAEGFNVWATVTITA